MCVFSDGVCVFSDGYVTAESGTGVVHQAPGFGEDDFRVCIAHGILRKVRVCVGVCV